MPAEEEMDHAGKEQQPCYRDTYRNTRNKGQENRSQSGKDQQDCDHDRQGT